MKNKPVKMCFRQKSSGGPAKESVMASIENGLKFLSTQ